MTGHEWEVVSAAADQIGRADDPEPNIEYDRAVVDMTCTLLGIDHGERQAVQDFLLALARMRELK
jgi:hypothetical protein